MATYFPEGIVFGANGFGDGFVFRAGQPNVLQIPLIPLTEEYAEDLALSFADFVVRCGAAQTNRSNRIQTESDWKCTS